MNTGSGFVLAVLTQVFIINPVWGLELSAFDNFGIIGIFTVISVFRSYAWRRIFNRKVTND